MEGMFTLQNFPVARIEINLEPKRACLREQALAQFKIHRHQGVVLVESGVEFEISQHPVVTLVDHEDGAGKAPSPVARQHEVEIQTHPQREGLGQEMVLHAVKIENPVFDWAGGNLVTDDDRPHPRRDGCTSHSSPRDSRLSIRRFRESVTRRWWSSKSVVRSDVYSDDA